MSRCGRTDGRRVLPQETGSCRVALVVGVVALLADRHHAQDVIAQEPLERVSQCSDRIGDMRLGPQSEHSRTLSRVDVCVAIL
jgi:hypothetical protein